MNSITIPHFFAHDPHASDCKDCKDCMNALSFVAALLLVTGAHLAEIGAKEVIEKSGGAEFLFWCYTGAGAIIGGILNIMTFGDAATRKQHARKFVGGICSSLLFTYLSLRWSGEASSDLRIVLAVSGVISMLSYGVLRKVVPAWEAWCVKKAIGRLEKSNDTNQ